MLSRSFTSANLNEIVIGLTNAIIRASDMPDASPRLGLVLDDYHHIHDLDIHASLQTWLNIFHSLCNWSFPVIPSRRWRWDICVRAG